MGPIGRIKRCAALLEQRLEECFARFGMTMWEFDVLATLRRSGAPFCLTPTALFSTLMVTSGTMTDRKSTRLNSSHLVISYAVFCLKKKKKKQIKHILLIKEVIGIRRALL